MLNFDGFRQQQGNFPFTMVPNQFLDEIVPNEKPCVVKVVCLILRRTLGWSDQNGKRRQQDQVAYSEFAREMNMSVQAVADGLKIALEKGYIIRLKQGTSHNNKTGFAEGAWYSLRWAATEQLLVEKPCEVESEIQSQPTLNNRVMINKAESKKNQVEINASSTSNAPIQPRKYSTYIGNVITDISTDFADSEHRLPNIKQALNLWQPEKTSEADFVVLLYQARDKTRAFTSANAKQTLKEKSWLNFLKPTEQATPKAHNRMAYFFRVLEELIVNPTQQPVCQTVKVSPNQLHISPNSVKQELVKTKPSVNQAQWQEWADNWSVDSQVVMQQWERVIGQLPAHIGHMLGIEASKASLELLQSLDLQPSSTQVDIILLLPNEQEASRVVGYFDTIKEIASQLWAKPVMLHPTCF